MSNGLFKREGVRYEVACDVLGAIIAHYAEVIGQEESKEKPDMQAIEAARLAIQVTDQRRDDLDPNDSQAIERVITECGPQARELYH